MGGTPAPVTNQSIQDVLFLENRDRIYDPVVYEMRGTYNHSDVDASLSQFGLFMLGDTIYLTVHLNDCIALCGRRINTGDVVELPHLRDDTNALGSPAINKYYVVGDCTKSSEGFSATWLPHLWRLQLSPMVAGQEYDSLLEQQALNPLGFPIGGATIGDLFTTIGNDLGLNEEIVNAAKRNVTGRYFAGTQFYLNTATDGVGNPEIPWLFANVDSSTPPNGAILVGSGNSFPSIPQDGDYYLRTDYQPPTLFRWSSNRWTIFAVDWRGTQWNAAHRILETFINNTNTSTFDDNTTAPEKQSLNIALKPRADF